MRSEGEEAEGERDVMWTLFGMTGRRRESRKRVRLEGEEAEGQRTLCGHCSG